MTDPFNSRKKHRSVRWGLIVQILLLVGLFVVVFLVLWFFGGGQPSPVEPIEPHMSPFGPGPGG